MDLVEKLCLRLRESYRGNDQALLCDFARLFYQRAPRHMLENRDSETLERLTEGAFRFLMRSHRDEVNVEVLNPSEEGWDAPVTVIRAAVGDRPFIVDTIREFLSAENIPIEQYVYPVLHVERDKEEIRSISAPDGISQEALVHCEIRPVADPARRTEIGRAIRTRLCDVVAATDDFDRMLGELDRTMEIVEREHDRYEERDGNVQEMLDFMAWLKDENFVFLGFRGYEIREEEGTGEAVVRVDPGSGLGILREESTSAYAEGEPISRVTPWLRERILSGPALIISKTNAESTVHRRARMDYVGLKRLDAAGNINGERRFLGLFTSKAYQENAESIPILRLKLREILRTSGAPPGSHDYKEIITIFNTMPKEDLFQASVAELHREIREVVSLLFSDEVRVSIRPDPLERGANVMVILPRGKFSGEVRHRIQDVLIDRFRGTLLNYHLAMSAGDQARLHFYLSADTSAVEAVNSGDLEREIRRLIRSWEDRLEDELGGAMPAAEAERLVRRYGSGFNEEYRAAFLPAIAARDIAQLERMQREDEVVAIDFRPPAGRGRAEQFANLTVLKLYLCGERLVLSDFMPILENLGLRVIEVTPFPVGGGNVPEFMMYAFAVQDPEGGALPPERAEILAETILAVRSGEATNDALNTLSLLEGLRWREVDILRTYANYTFQIRAVPSRASMTRALLGYPGISRLLVELFHARFDPARSGKDTGGLSSELVQEGIHYAMDDVSALGDDRALRRMFGLINATLRTNYFACGGADPHRRSGGVPYISIKVRPGKIEELQRDRLFAEVFVFSSRMEGIHLRGAPVSRGGIRWSDRQDDYRTEVLGLTLTQVVKNAVIVPGGSKGGFVTKRFFEDRDAMGGEAAEQYRTLIRGLLDLTDNIVQGRVVHPEGVVRYDEDDPYLVVAADKGTAHLSDTANAVAEEYDFWLGDAFASGGSYGYDHKKEGITARGAWECVRRHFREMGKDIQKEPFTVIGIGDMSGDVFGNGMLLSRQIRLVAAFDHRHVFIDPDPDPAVGYEERERLFHLPRSSWADYDESKLSKGGMIIPRVSKEISLTEEARSALGVTSDGKLDGEGLVQAILRAPAELLWNGGIGTYVKSSAETHAAAGDSANDPVRIDAGELRCQVLGEGGNLGLTQRARIEYALQGGRINTDALDNSAGVDMSDHEVNLKILLGGMVADGEMDLERRNDLLGEMTDRVNALVLRNNQEQSLAVSLDETRSREDLWDFAALLLSLEEEGLLKRGSDGLPTTETFQERAEARLGLTRPVLSTLLAYAKIHAKTRLLASPLPDDPATHAYLFGYFPGPAVEAAGGERLLGHRLHREIITTELTNELVNLMGAAFLHRMARDSGRDIYDVVRAWLIANRLAGAAEMRADLHRAEGSFPAETIYRWLFGLARVLEHTTHWTLANVAPDAPAEAVIEQNKDGLARLRAEFAGVVAGEDKQVFHDRLDELHRLGLERETAERIITLRFLPQLLEILRIANERKSDPADAARAYYQVSHAFGCAALQRKIRERTGDDRWEKRHAQELIEDVGRAHRSLARSALTATPQAGDIDRALVDLETERAREVGAYRELVAEIGGEDRVPLAGFAVAVRALDQVASPRHR